MKWLRLYHDTPNDPKWRLVAVRSGQPVGNVLAVWMQMLVCASEAEVRGILEGWDDEIVAAVLGYPPSAVTAIRAGMQGLVLDGYELTGWDKRQKASDNVAERVQRHRKKPREPGPDDGSSGNGLDPDGHEAARGGNGASRDRNGTETLQTEDVTLHSAGVTLGSSRAKTPDSQIEDSRGGTRARARGGDLDWICQEIAGMTNLPVTDANRKVVADMVEGGADPAEDILPAVRAKLDTTQFPLDRIDGFGFFRNCVEKHRHQRLHPQPVRPANVHPLRPRRPREAGAQALLDRLDAMGRDWS